MPHQHHVPDMERLENTKTAAERIYTELWHLHPYGHRDAGTVTLLKRAARDYDRAMLDLANARLALPEPPSAKSTDKPKSKSKNFSYHLHHAHRTVTIDRHQHHTAEAQIRPEKYFKRSHPSYRPDGRFSARSLGYPLLNTCNPYDGDPSAQVSEPVICASLDEFRLRCNRHGDTYPMRGHCPRCHPETQARPAPKHSNRHAKPLKSCLKPGSSSKALPPTPAAPKPDRPLLRQRSSAQALREFQAGKQREKDAAKGRRQAPEVQGEFLQPHSPHHHSSRSPSPQPLSPHRHHHHHHHSSRPSIELLRIPRPHIHPVSLARSPNRDVHMHSPPPPPQQREHHHHHHHPHRSPLPAPTQTQHAHREPQSAWRDRNTQRDHPNAQERERSVQRGRELLLRGLEEPQHHQNAQERERSVQRGRELLRRGLGL